MAGNSVLAKMAVQISANNADFARAMNRSRKDLTTFTNSVHKIAGALGVAFGLQQVADFALEVSKLSGEAKAVRAAFERLPESTKLMQDLKRATGGTVSELDLMKRAVQASNFDISLKALPRLLEFATLRAQQTGQSVDYLVDSIVTGIGRKSKLILDNLGISAVQLNEALGGASTAASTIGEVADAVGKIAEENLKNMEGFSDNASTKLQQLTASWTNLKVAIGDAANGTGVLSVALDAVISGMNVLASRDLSKFEKIAAIVGSFIAPGAGFMDSAAAIAAERMQQRINKEHEKQAQIIKEVDRAFVEFSGNIDAYSEAIQTHIYKTELLAEFTKRLVQADDDRIVTVGELREIERELLAERDNLNSVDQKAIDINTAQVQAIREKIKAIDDLLTKEKELTSYTLSQTSQRALAGSSVSGVTGLSGIGSIEVDTGAMFSKMEAFRNTNAEVTTEVAKNWLDLSGIVGGTVTSLAESFGAAIVGAEDFGTSVLQAFAGFAKEFGSMLIATGTAALALEGLFSNPFAAIAAGAALVAIAGAASASISKSHSGLTGASSAGRTPSEMRLDIGGRIHGYDLAIVTGKTGYKRGWSG